jgi:hypothetical protein
VDNGKVVRTVEYGVGGAPSARYSLAYQKPQRPPGYDNPRAYYPCDEWGQHIRLERCRQVLSENWTPEHDLRHSAGQLADAAAAYACNSDEVAAKLWPFVEPIKRATKSRKRQLVIAAALILAELERMDRAEPPVPVNADGMPIRGRLP